ncbi:type VI secretion system baseplate subunit TssF, partial [Janthinobacterium sp.]|uniref:type VI secretion system baseplate subunit TssF n=1 Tax=Janthinobacterium sp. TaxID=1871054 RepID=UPI00293D29A0
GVALTVRRGSALRAAGDDARRYVTAYEVRPAPLALAGARFDAAVAAPPSVRLPPGAASSLSILIEGDAGAAGLARLGARALRVCIDGDAELCAALRDALFMHAASAYVEVAGAGHWSLLDRIPLMAVGFSDADTLLPEAPPTCRILGEFFAFPDKFNFFDIDLPTLLKYAPAVARRLNLSLHLVLRDVGADAARALARLSERQFLLGCTPVLELELPAAGVAGAGAAVDSAWPLRLLRAASAVRRLPRPLDSPWWPSALPLAPGEAELAACAELLNAYAAQLSPRWGGAIAGFRQRPAYAWRHARRGAVLVRGVELSMRVEPAAVRDGGCHAFAQVVAHFLCLSLAANSFIELLVVAAGSGRLLLRLPPRHGA